MRKYKCIKIGYRMEDTEERLNELAREGWRVVCSYAYDNDYLILVNENEWLMRG